MPSFELTCKDAVLGVLIEARSAGISGITRTSLVKYIYLLDTFVAEEKSGASTWTGLEWKFHHFGPHAVALIDCLDWMEKHSFLDRDERSSAEGKDFILYHAPQRADIKSLAALGIPANVISRLAQVLRDYAYSLPKLLDFVYFRTTPMADARPQETLRFDACRRANYKEDIRPVSLSVPDKKKIERMRELLAVVRQQNGALGRAELSNAIYDDYYAQALQGSDGTELRVATDSIVATLQFPTREEDERR